jgi:molecular chaperone IbpA
MRSNIDFTPFRQATVGFDRLFDLLESSLPSQITDNYPPFDLVQEDDDHYRISLAVAGFGPEDIDVTVNQNLLIVSGRKSQEDQSRYIHRGIAARSFERRFALADYVKVKSADLSDGMLSVELAREIPEEMKPRKIAINGGGNVHQLESSSGGQQSTTQQKELAAA